VIVNGLLGSDKAPLPRHQLESGNGTAAKIR